MNDPRSIIEARKYGEIRCAVVSEMTNDMSRVLGKFGLTPDASMLVQHSRESAFAILRELLWKDMAYEGECMPKSQAEEIANHLLQQHSIPESKFFSNGDWSKRESWYPLTESTFDAGLIVSGSNGTYFCIWFQDED
ncbi:hypothetical protein SAMN05216359_12713 [Roseateles sp. YR242]|uniref:hypothetical protein n=1 Tax=Roseateles sp. YR242 TaxID=1855305 RepID=UPI0008D31DAC|nr:hypothetical protein [Roseateles sp. YR242]SEL92962.1 hypothetical protein SAMN05216359_12713 [Roseateles sp. YR242]